MHIPITAAEMRPLLIGKYNTSLIEGNIEIYTEPAWPCDNKTDTCLELRMYLTTSRGTRYRLVEETPD